MHSMISTTADPESTKENLRAHPSEQASLFFPDVHGRFKFCVFLTSPQSSTSPTRFGFFLDDPAQVHDPEKWFEISPSDFQKVNPTTGTAPVFRTRRDAELTFSSMIECQFYYMRSPTRIIVHGPSNITPCTIRVAIHTYFGAKVSYLKMKKPIP